MRMSSNPLTRRQSSKGGRLAGVDISMLSSRMDSTISQSRGSKRQSRAEILPEMMLSHHDRKATVRSFLLRKQRARYQRRKTMKPISRQIPSTDPMIARRTSPAGPSFSTALKTNAITQSEAVLDLIVAPILAGEVAVDVLSVRQLVTESTAIGVGRDASDLIDLGEILATHPEEKVAGQARLQGESKFAPAGWHPVNR